MPEEPASILREGLQWVKAALPWAALGIGGGALRVLDPANRVTFRGAVALLIRSTLVGAIVGLVTDDFDFRLGSKVVLIVFCAFGADSVLAIASDIWGRIRSDPWTFLRWMKGRVPDPPPPQRPPGDGRPKDREEGPL